MRSKFIFKTHRIIFLLMLLHGLCYAQENKNLPPEIQQVTYQPSARPDRVLLSFADNTATSFTLTWRTDSTVTKAILEVAIADAAPAFSDYKQKTEATYTRVATNTYVSHYHSATVTNLLPATLYAYRVGNGTYWSEWFHYRTAHQTAQPFSFIYLGDAQNKIYSYWSRAIRGAYQEAPKASFIVHAGDLINHANNDYEWAEWFAAGSFIHATVPAVVTPGNHEYEKSGSEKKISDFWIPQFNAPRNGPVGLTNQTYYFDYQGVRMISLNSNEQIDAQAKWLEILLANNPNTWTFVTFHHPVYSAAEGRSNETLLKYWKPLFDKYKVDMVLQGHDHTYARGNNVAEGINKKDKSTGTIYVVSVSGPKMYPITENRWMKRAAENSQVYQVIEVDGDKLRYKAVLVTGELYDSFELHKQKGKPNRLIEGAVVASPERRVKNTLKEKE